MIELYYLKEADSICSNRVVLTLAEKGIDDWVPRTMSLVDGDQFAPDLPGAQPEGPGADPGP